MTTIIWWVITLIGCVIHIHGWSWRIWIFACLCGGQEDGWLWRALMKVHLAWDLGLSWDLGDLDLSWDLGDWGKG